MESINLNPTGQEELYERSVRRMAELAPGWSDAIPSDPAVTLLELLTGLSNVQNQRIDEVRQEHYLAYLKLLGEKPKALLPARFRAIPETRTGLFPHKRFQIDGIPFEVEDGWQYGDALVKEAVLEHDEIQWKLRSGSPLRLTQENWERLTVTFSSPLPAGSAVHLWCEIEPEPDRVPPDDETTAPFRLQGSMWNNKARTWENTQIRDGTCGFLRSGWLEWTPPSTSDRLCLTADGQVEGAPLLKALILEPVTLAQRRTRSMTMDLRSPFCFPRSWAGDYALRFFLPAGDGAWRETPALFIQEDRVCGHDAGCKTIRIVAVESDFSARHTLRSLPMEWVAVEEHGVLPDSLQVMVEEDGLWYDCPVCVTEPDLTLERGCRWDAEMGRLCFGNGRDFRVPKGGEVLISGCACTMGSDGNGAGGVLESGGVRLFALGTACGGQDSETPGDAYARVAKEQTEPLRAVTCEDYAEVARRTPGLALERVTALPGGALEQKRAGIRLFVLPRSDQPLPALTAWQKARLTQWIERHRLIGVPVTVQGPKYLPVQVSVTLRAAGQLSEAALRSITQQFVDGIQGQADFGAELSHPALYSALSAADGVLSIQALELRPLGRGAKRTQGGSWTLEGDVLPFLKQFKLNRV